MNADLKQQIEDVLAEWHNSDDDLFSFEETGDRMAALLQELADAPEAEPFAVIHLDGSFVHVEFKQTIAGTGKFEVYAAPPAPSVPETEPVAYATGYYAGRLSIATIDGRVLPAGTALYAAPPHQSEHHLEMVNTPAPSVPDGWKHDCAGIMQNDVELWLDSCPHCGKPKTDAAPPVPSVPDGWIRAIDEAMVVHHIGIADRADSYEVAKKKLNALLAINSDIARDCSEAPADLVRDAERWQMLPAFLAEFQVPYLQLVDKIDAAIEREILGVNLERNF